jgi:hypothetical protein
VTRRWRAVALGVVAVSAVALAPSAAAQPSLEFRPEVRVDAILARRSALHAGFGASVPLGRSVRLELAGAAGSIVGRGDNGFSGRVDAIGRFVLDPFYQSRWGAYTGGGISLRYDRDVDWRGLLALVVGLEGRLRDGVLPFVEIGYGGGVRIGGGLRWASRSRR